MFDWLRFLTLERLALCQSNNAIRWMVVVLMLQNDLSRRCAPKLEVQQLQPALLV